MSNRPLGSIVSDTSSRDNSRPGCGEAAYLAKLPESSLGQQKCTIAGIPCVPNYKLSVRILIS